MEELINSMKKVLADTFVMYLKSHNYHWNVVGVDFSQYHAFFGDLYTELWEAVDPIAEHIRALDGIAPGSLARFQELATVQDELGSPYYNTTVMAQTLLKDNQIVLDTLRDAYRMAERFDELGLQNFLQDRMDIHKKHGWMLRAMTK